MFFFPARFALDMSEALLQTNVFELDVGENVNITVMSSHIGKFCNFKDTRKYTHRASKRRRVLFAVVWREPGVVCYHI